MKNKINKKAVVKSAIPIKAKQGRLSRGYAEQEL